VLIAQFKQRIGRFSVTGRNDGYHLAAAAREALWTDVHRHSNNPAGSTRCLSHNRPGERKDGSRRRAGTSLATACGGGQGDGLFASLLAG
jgi:hypothetical protein